MHLDVKKPQALSQEVENLAAKEAIQLADNREGYTSLIFLVPKSDGSWPPVINLKSCTEQVCDYSSFQNGINQDSKGVKAGGRLANQDIDLKDAYLMVPLHSSHQPLPRRYADNGKKPGGSKEIPSHSNGATDDFTIYNQPEKEHPLTNTGVKIFLVSC